MLCVESAEYIRGDDRIRQELSGRGLRAEAATTLVNQAAKVTGDTELALAA